MRDEQTPQQDAAEDERLTRALEIHQRLMREYNWDYLGIHTEAATTIQHPRRDDAGAGSAGR